MGSASKRLIAAALTVLALVTACGDDGEKLYPVSATSALITTTDLGTGWKKGGFDTPSGTPEGPDTDKTKDDTFSPCAREVGPDPFTEAIAKADAQFNRAGRLLIDSIGVFPTVEDATEAVVRYRKAFDDCHEWTDSDQGSEIRFKTKKLDIPGLGDESAGHRITGDLSGGSGPITLSGTIIGEISLVRRLNVISTIAQLSIGVFESKAVVDTADTVKALRAANEKLTNVKTVAGPLPSVKPVPSSTASATGAAPSATPAKTRASVGESLVVSGADGVKLSVTLLKVTNPAEGEEFFEPSEGSRYVGVQLRLGNVGSKLYDDSPGNGATLVDTADQQHSENGAEIKDGPGFEGAVRLQPEDSRQGYLVFEVPDEAQPRLFQFTLDSGFGPQTAEWEIEDVPFLPIPTSTSSVRPA
jgi:hypothetical protein